MPSNELLPFATGSGANVQGQREYSTSETVSEGFEKGLVPSDIFNKAIRQATFGSAMLGAFIVSVLNEDVVDNGDVQTIFDQFQRALSVYSQGAVNQYGQQWATSIESGLANANVFSTVDEGLSKTSNGQFFSVPTSTPETDSNGNVTGYLEGSSFAVGYINSNGKAIRYGTIPGEKQVESIYQGVMNLIAAQHVGDDERSDLVFGAYDANGNETWLQAQSKDGGPSDLSLSYLQEYTGVTPTTMRFSEYLWGVVDNQGNTTDLLVRQSDGRVPDFVLNDWSRRIGVGGNVQFGPLPGYLWGVTDNDGNTTDLLLNKDDGRIADHVMDDWSGRIGGGYKNSSHAPNFQIMSSMSRALGRFAKGIAPPTQSNQVQLNGQNCQLTTPAWYTNATPVVLCLYFEGVGGSDRLSVYYAWKDGTLEDCGIIYGRSQFHGDSYGDQDSMVDARAVYDYAVKNYNVGGVVLLGASMGGLGALNALTTGTIPDVLGVYLIDGDANMDDVYARHKDEIDQLYGVSSDGSDYHEKVDPYNPMIQDNRAFKGVPIWVNGSYEDNTVPFVHNGLLLAEKLKYTNDINITTYSGGHFSDNHFDAAHLQSFIETVTGGNIQSEM